MSKHPAPSDLSRRWFLATAGALAATSSVKAGKAAGLPREFNVQTPATNDYVITVDVTVTPISYKATANGGTTSVDAYRLLVNTGDKVAWRAATKGAKNHIAILFIGTTPFVDVYALHGDKQTNSGIVGNGPATFEYYVAVFDEDPTNPRSYTDDPKIIVGSGNMIVSDRIRILDQELRGLNNDVPKDKREKLERIEGELEKLSNELKK